MRRILVLFVMILLGCGQPKQETTDTDFLGEWHRTEANCAACDRWVFSRQVSGEWQAVRLTTASMTDSPVRTQYQARSEGDRMVVTQQEERASGTITDGQLSLMGKTLQKDSLTVGFSP